MAAALLETAWVKKSLLSFLQKADEVFRSSLDKGQGLPAPSGMQGLDLVEELFTLLGDLDVRGTAVVRIGARG